MSILDTFYILFKSDASEVKKGAEEAQKATQNLQDKLKSTDKSAEHLGESFLSAARSALGLVAGLASVATVISTISDVRELGKSSRALQVNVEDLDAWGSAVERSGGSAQEFQSSLSSLADHLGTTGNIALKTLPLFADAFSRMNQTQANRYGKSLGLDQSTIYLLQQGRREVEDTIKRQKEFGTVTKEDVEVTRKFDVALFDLGKVLQFFQRELALPFLSPLTKSFEYLVEHKDLIKGALIAIGIGVAAMAASFAIANPAIAVAAVALALFVGAYEDYQKFKRGEPSLIGDINEDFKSVKNKINNDITALKNFPNEAKKAIYGLKDDLYNSPHKLVTAFQEAKDFYLPKVSNIFGHNNSKANSINVNSVTINTQATNGQDIKAAFVDNLTGQQYQSNSYFDDVVAR